MKFFTKNEKKINIVCMIILALYPMLRVGQGLSVMDTTYSLANFRFFDKMSGTWMVATYLANVVGSLLMKLPFGTTMTGINVYTSCIVSLTAVLTFNAMKKDIPVPALFMGEFIALGLCWCPTTILYNYLTYFLFGMGALLLYKGLCGGHDDCFMAAGILLGLNVMTRFPNITEAALILAVWYAGIIEHKKFSRVAAETLMCMGGYLVGFIIPLFTVAIRYSASAYPDMITTLFAMTDKATDYKPTSMITAMFGDYVYSFRWMLLFLLGMLVCSVVYLGAGLIGRKKIPAAGTEKRKRTAAVILLSAAVMLTVTRAVYGRGMFSFRFYEYGSVYFWAVILIAISTVISLIYIFIPEKEDAPGSDTGLHRKKILGAMVLIMTYITCLGSNNGMYPIVNNMFLVAPYTVWIIFDLLRHIPFDRSLMGETDDAGLISAKKSMIGALKYGAGACAFTVILGTFIMSIGFHLNFALQDGDEGQIRDSEVTADSRLTGISTTQTNAASIDGLIDYMNETDDRESVILYGDIPGLGYILDRESALSTFWPDLDSYTYGEWSEDLSAVKNGIETGEEVPVVITSVKTAAWLGGDEAAMEYFGVDRQESDNDVKLSELKAFMDKYGYSQTYCNDMFSVYRIR